MKLKPIKAYDVKNTPDHVLEEVKALSKKMIDVLLPALYGISPNLILSSMNVVYVTIIKMVVDNQREELENAAKFYAVSIIKNMQILIEQMEEEKF